MAGHSHFANIKHKKDKADKIKAKVFTKIAREIIIAVKSGLPDPEANPRLRSAMAAARAANMTNDRIKSAIAQGTGSNKGDDYEEIRYEGYGTGGVALIVEALTNNRNRTASDIRSTFTKWGGNLGETNSVAFNFEKVGQIQYPAAKGSADDFLEAAIDAGADDCESGEEVHTIYCKPDQLMEVATNLAKKFGDAEAKFSWKATNTIPANFETAESVFKLVEALEDYDDVQNVITNIEIDDETLQKLAS